MTGGSHRIQHDSTGRLTLGPLPSEAREEMEGLHPSCIDTVVLNGTEQSNDELLRVVGALCDPIVLRRRGGFLFKSWTEGKTLYLGIIPAFTNGERGYHYSISLAGEDAFILVGTIDVQGAFTILFKPREPDIQPIARRVYADAYVSLARVLLQFGYSGRGELDQVTRSLLESARLFTTDPEDLAALPAMPYSMDLSGE